MYFSRTIYSLLLLLLCSSLW